jgi:tetratricopeptide (TPR) repeat protein
MNSWHSWSPNGRWLVFSSKAFSPYTQLFLTHVDAEGRDTPPVLLENFTPADRAANIPEFVNLAPERLVRIREQFVDDISFWRAGNEYVKARDFAGAAASFRKALEINPRCAPAYAGLGLALAAERKPDEAIPPLMKAIEIQPSLPGPHFGLAGLLASKGRMPEALAEALVAVRLQPDHTDAQSLAGALLLATGKPAEATEHLAAAIRLGSADATAYYNLAQALCFTGKYEEAIPHYEEVLRHRPDHPSALNALAMALARTGRTDEAIGRLMEALRLKPDPGKHFSLATLLAANGQPREAVAHCRKALQLQPDHAPAMTFLAWILATADDAGLRSGAEAVQLATQACELTQSREPRSLGALAAAWAETGRFPQAVQAAAKAAELARAQGNATLSREIEQQVALYQQGKPFRSSFGKAASAPPPALDKTGPAGDSRR